MDRKKSDTGHVYMNRNCREVPGVTTIIQMLNKPELVGWANNLGFMGIRVYSYLDERAAIGTDFHQMVEDYMNGKPVGGEHYKEAIEMFKRFQIWARCHYYKVFKTELSLVGKDFGGTIDALGEVDGVFTLVDYKTSKKVYNSQFIQLAGYAVLLQELMPETYEKLEAFGIVTMLKELAHKFISKADIEKKFVPVFLSALRLYQSYYEMENNTYI